MKNTTRSNRLFKITGVGLAIFALSFGVWLNFRETPNNIAKAMNPPTETIRAITNDDGGDPWIHFDGQSYINTGIDQIGDTKIMADFQYDQASVGKVTIVSGAYVTSNDSAFSFGSQPLSPPAYQRAVMYGGSGVWNSFGQDTDTARHTVTFEATPPNWTATLDSITISGATTTPPVTPLNLYLGGFNNNNGLFSPASTHRLIGKIYAYKIWKNGTLVRHLVPAAKYSGCDDDFTVEYGFIDLANSHQWYGNGEGATGTLTGSEIIAPTICPTEPENPDVILPPNTGKL